MNEQSASSPHASARLRWVRLVASLSILVAWYLMWLVSQWWVHPMPQGTIVQITHGRNFEGNPSLSPDGTRVAYR